MRAFGGHGIGPQNFFQLKKVWDYNSLVKKKLLFLKFTSKIFNLLLNLTFKIYFLFKFYFYFLNFHFCFLKEIKLLMTVLL